ncbi:hypothetical protein CH063_07977 [Colletotrichum higginsianum]|uniref:Uncharacterized protein n=1 Tax=Colletotrichum higginsianum (strain IMI 349063) TaxID=759273 RepID=H1V841_COLHI|nr:hypothetical protein CH063_07977 [Colletotrichum higginsianum]
MVLKSQNGKIAYKTKMCRRSFCYRRKPQDKAALFDAARNSAGLKAGRLRTGTPGQSVDTT